MQDPDTINVAAHAVRIRRHARARRLTLRIGAQGPVLTLPKRAALRDAQAFLTTQSEWLRDKLAVVPKRQAVTIGSRLPFAGDMITLAPAPDGKTSLSGDTLLVPANRAARAARTFLIGQARADVTAASRDYANQIGHRFGKITMRDTRSRWGSCTSKGDLNYSWRLIMAPAEVLDYVAAHEVAHLAQMNHGRKFWALVARICPDYAIYRDWLRANGPDLHRYRFDA